MSTTYISPTGSGSGDGSSWANAARISKLSAMIDKAGAGGTVLLRADQGAYNLSSYVPITAGGSSAAWVTIRGVDGAGADLDAQIVGTRNLATGAGGNEVFRLLGGADNLLFENLQFNNIGNGAFRIGANISNLTIQSVRGYNVERLVENYASGSNTTASVNGLVLQDVEVHGYSKGVVRLQYDSRNIVLNHVIGDSERQGQDDFAMGVHLEGTVHDVLISHTTMANSFNNHGDYWNGDGFATEAGVYRVTFQNTNAIGNTDGGYDLKSKATTLINAYASGNKDNYRFWSDSITLQNSIGEAPHRQGGTGNDVQVWLAQNAKVTIINSQFLNTPPGGVIYELQKGAHLTLAGAISYSGDGAVYSQTATGASISKTATIPATAQIGAVDPSPGVMDGTDASETLAGTASADAIRGFGGNDSIDGGAGDDDVNGNTGSDTVHGGDGADIVRGGQANDLVFGDAGNDVHVNGNLGDDIVHGGAGDDTVYGGQGDDTVYGDDGADRISGDLGADLLYGGLGADRFLLRSGGGVDWAVDFNAAEGDRVQLAPGAAYTVVNQGGQAVIALSTGDSIGLVGVSFSSFSPDWIAYG